MLSRPDFEEKQIVVINSDEFKQLSLKNDNLLITQDEKIVNQISCFKIFCIFIVWDFTITSKLIDKFLEYQIVIYHFSINLKPKFIIWNSLEWNYVLRQKQYNLENELNFAKQIIQNKSQNQIFLLKNIRNKSESLKSTIQEMEIYCNKVKNTENIDSLRWVEWNIAKIYFKEYFSDIGWYKRMPRTRVDVLNLLMDIWYSYLYGFIEANLNLYGFDIYKWFYHKLFYERKSLTCDLIEPFRCIIDHKIKKIYNLWQVNEKDFRFHQQEYSLDREKNKIYSKYFLEEIMKYKQEIFNYIKGFYKVMMKWEDILPIFSMQPEKNVDS